MNTTPHAPGTFCWFECASTNADEAKIFYTKLFGWAFADTPLPGEMAGDYTLLKIGDDDIAGMYQMAGPMFEGVPSHWATYVTVADVDESARQAAALGGKVVAGPMDVPGVGRMAFLEDPTGANIAIFKPGEHSGSTPLGMAPNSFCWSELATRDTAAAKAFYTELFNWKAKTDEGNHVQYTEFIASNQPIGGLMEMQPEQAEAPPHWLPYVMVLDCKATAEQVAELGGQIAVPPTDIPHVGRFSVFTDPAGAALAVIQMADSPPNT